MKARVIFVTVLASILQFSTALADDVVERPVVPTVAEITGPQCNQIIQKFGDALRAYQISVFDNEDEFVRSGQYQRSFMALKFPFNMVKSECQGDQCWYQTHLSCTLADSGSEQFPAIKETIANHVQYLIDVYQANKEFITPKNFVKCTYIKGHENQATCEVLE